MAPTDGPPEDSRVPSGAVARIEANLAAIEVRNALRREERAATGEEREVLARYSSWGAAGVSKIFEEPGENAGGGAAARMAERRERLRALLTGEEYEAARLTTINAHYTSPELAGEIWRAVQGLGFTGGQVLEPGCGTGNFFGSAPPGARMTGVELDPVTADIAAALHPEAQVVNASFADVRGAGGYDLAIGNVPFSSVQLTDARFNAGNHAMHNHFIIKSLELVRPGGLVAVLTSRYTMDGGRAARVEMARLAELVTAVRLPSDAHRRTAGTDVVTDLLVFRRREKYLNRTKDLKELDWLEANEVPGKLPRDVRINDYWLSRRPHVLGVLVSDQGARGRAELAVRGDAAKAPEQLGEILAAEVERARGAGLTFTPAGAAAPARDVPRLIVPDKDAARFEGLLSAHDDGSFTVLTDGQPVPFPVPATQAAELRRLIALRDTRMALLDAERATAADTPELDALRARLNEQYDDYVDRHGPLNRVRMDRTGRVDEHGDDVMRRVFPPQGGFRRDPFCWPVYGLESFDETSGTARKTSIFTERVARPRTPPAQVDSPADALMVSLDVHGEADLGQVARLLGSGSPREAREALGELVYQDPGTGRLIPAARYLSGDVRAKLAEASTAALADERYRANVRALARCVPPDLGPGDIDVILAGANSWVPPDMVQEFLRETLQDPRLTAYSSAGVWTVSGNDGGVLATEVWGTKDYSALDLAKRLLDGRPVRVLPEPVSGTEDPAADRSRRRAARNRAAVATAEARGKAAELDNRFAEWLWEDPDRGRRLLEIYNAKFNSLVPPAHDGAWLTLPGLADGFSPRAHQLAAVARILTEPSVLLAHEVGAGKTAEMIIGAMELRRLGKVTKPAMVVPNHVVEQFGREFMRLYPQADVLVVDGANLTADRRKRLVASMATRDWDAIVIPQSVFELIPLSAEEQKDYIDEQTRAFKVALDKAQAKAGVSEDKEAKKSVKEAEARLLAMRERLKRKLARDRDAGISWEQTGIDYLFVDEAHHYKNLNFATNNRDLAIDGSNRAADLHMKLSYQRRAYEREHVATFATATPVTNALAEVWTMLRYLAPGRLEAAGVADFDGFVGQFAQSEEVAELTPEGSGVRVKERITRYRNLQPLLRMWLDVADVKLARHLGLPVPELKDGKAATVVVPPSPEQLAHRGELDARVDRIRDGSVEPDADGKTDNMLWVMTDGAKAALDMRTLGRTSSAPGKLAVAAANIARIYHANKDNTYLEEDGGAAEAVGAFQFVFCDLSTPSGDKPWNAYDELRLLLAEHGVPFDQVRFIHEARNRREAEALLQQARTGGISVLVGSTPKMGTGVNAQDIAIALHHLDCPKRPDEVTQRNGRLLRQGNKNLHTGRPVEIYQYVTEGSVDAYMWQLIERKITFISQVVTGEISVNEIEELAGDVVLSPTETKALASGDMRLLTKAKLDSDVLAMERQASGHRRAQAAMKNVIANGERDIAGWRGDLDVYDAALERRVSTRGDAFTMRIGDGHYDKRPQAALALHDLLAGHVARMRDGDVYTADLGVVGGLGGFTLTGTIVRRERYEIQDGKAATGQAEVVTEEDVDVGLSFEDVPYGGFAFAFEALDRRKPSIGWISQAENQLRRLEEYRETVAQSIAEAQAQIEVARAQIGRPYPRAAELAAARHEADRLGEELRADQEDAPAAPVITETTEPYREEFTEEVAAYRAAERLTEDNLLAYVSTGQDTAVVTAHRPEGPYLVADQDGTWRSFADPADPGVQLAGHPADTDLAALLARPSAGPEPRAPAAEAGAGDTNMAESSNDVAAIEADPEPGATAMDAAAEDGAHERAAAEDSSAEAGPAAEPMEAAPHEPPAPKPSPQAADPARPDATPAPEGAAQALTDRATPPNEPVRTSPPDTGTPERRLEETEPAAPGEPPAADRDEATEPSPPASAAPASGADDHSDDGDQMPAQSSPVAEPAAGPWSARIRIDDTAARPTVAGTRYEDERLRAALRDNGFRWRKQRTLWEYTGPAAAKEAAVAAIADLVAELDQAGTGGTGRSFPPTAQQQAIIDACLAGQDVAVQALAGTGKTSTLRMVADAMPGRSITYIAFNRSIAKEARGAFGPGVTSLTAHALALRSLRAGPYADKIDRVGKGARHPGEIAELLGLSPVEYVDEDGERQVLEPPVQAQLAMDVVRKFRESADIEITGVHLPDALMAFPGTAEAVLTTARRAWEDIADPGNAGLLARGKAGAILFDHDDYLKIWALSRPRIDADVIFFDEAQDINDVLRQVVQDQPTQTVVVGDTYQSIYAFRGAKDALADWPADVTLPLTRSWRFGPPVAAIGDDFLRLLGAPYELEGNPALDSAVGMVDDPDAILCRTNVGAVSAVFDAFDGGKRVALVGGGSAVSDLAKAAKDLKAGRGTKHPELSRFTTWIQLEQATKEERALQSFVRLIEQHAPDELLRMVDRLVDEDATGRDAPDVVVSTAHKAKGREWDSVRIAGDFYGPKFDKEGRIEALPPAEELRLSYVVVTRGRREVDLGSLVWIEDVSPGPGHSPGAALDVGADRQSMNGMPADPAPVQTQDPDGPSGTEASPKPETEAQPFTPAPAASGAEETAARPSEEPRPSEDRRVDRRQAEPDGGQPGQLDLLDVDALRPPPVTPAAADVARERGGGTGPEPWPGPPRTIDRDNPDNASHEWPDERVWGREGAPAPGNRFVHWPGERPAEAGREGVGRDGRADVGARPDQAAEGMAEPEHTESDEPLPPSADEGEVPHVQPAPGPREATGTRPARQPWEQSLDRAFGDVLASLAESPHTGVDADEAGGSDGEERQPGPIFAYTDLNRAFQEIKNALSSDAPAEDIVDAIVAAGNRATPADRRPAEPDRPAAATASPAAPHPPEAVEEALEQPLEAARTALGARTGEPEWQRINAVAEASRNLGRTLTEAAGSYAREVHGDIRTRGFRRMVAARGARTIATAAYGLANRLERGAAHAVRALRELARKAADHADRLTGALPPGRTLQSMRDLQQGWNDLDDMLEEAPKGGTGNGSRGPAALLQSSVTAMRHAVSTAADTIGPAVADTAAWKRITAVWNGAAAALAKAHQGVLRFEEDAGALGFFSAVWTRTCETVSWGARQAMEHLDDKGAYGGTSWHALRLLRHTAEETIAHLRGHLPRDQRAPMGTYDPPRDLETSAAPSMAAENIVLQEPATSRPSPPGTTQPVSEDRDRTLAELIPVLDAIDSARKHGELTGGFAQVGRLAEQTAARLGLSRIGEEGERFDPARHDAVAYTGSSGEDLVTTEVLRPGYVIDGRVVRPASVVVGEGDGGPDAELADAQFISAASNQLTYGSKPSPAPSTATTPETPRPPRTDSTAKRPEAER